MKKTTVVRLLAFGRRQILLLASTVLLLPLARGAATGDPDTFAPEPNSIVQVTAVQPDGQILLGGVFTMPRLRAARFSSVGVLDDFSPDPNSVVNCMAVQEDGRILMGGTFSDVGGVACSLARVNADGSLDLAFNPAPNNSVNCLALQADGSIIVGGTFTNIAGTPRRYLARLNPTGGIDAGFDPSPDDHVFSVAVQPDGKTIVGGLLADITGVARRRIARLNTNGTLDTNFTASVITGGGGSGIYSLAVQADGKIIVGGDFTNITGVARSRIARLNTNGTLDTNFTASAAGNFSASLTETVKTLALQTDGKIIVGGRFTSMNGVGKNFVARLNTNGTLDTNFSAVITNTQTNFNEVAALALPDDGKVLMGGHFSEVNGQGRAYFARLHNDSATQSLTIPATNRVQWLRGGSSPEVQYVTFELSTNGGNTYTLLGRGTRINGGWQLTGLSLPAAGKIRARARASGGQYNGSSGLLEAILLFGSQSDISVSGNGLEINDGDTTPRLADDTDFGIAGSTPAVVVRTFTITNSGNINLTLGPVTVGGTNSADFSVTAQPAATLAPGESTTFQITFAPVAIGLRSATVSFTNNALGKSPFAFNIQGTGTNTLDSTFAVDVSDDVYALAVQPDGRILIGGDFFVVNGGARYRVARLKTDGSLDVSFDPYYVNGFVRCLAVQPDGKILVGGQFSLIANGSRPGLARLHPDGTLDFSFNPTLDHNAHCIALQADGKVLVGGAWTVGGTNRYFARLNTDGTSDPSFTATLDNILNSIVVQPDGRILLGGGFNTVNGVSVPNVARLNTNGTVDGSLTPSFLNSSVNCLALQTDGKILLGGDFVEAGGNPITRNNIARWNADGSPDTNFNAQVGYVSGSTVESIVVQADGRILFCGRFPYVAGFLRRSIARVSPDGTLDQSFNPDPNFPSGSVHALALQADGRVVFGGDFTTVGDVEHSRLARMLNEPAPQSLTVPTANRIQWLRGGSSPESHLITFESQTYGSNSYTLLGRGTRISGGWELTGLSLPANCRIRARAQTVSGYQNGSVGYVEAFAFRGSFPEPTVSGKSVIVTNGDSTPLLADGTDFGTVPVPSGAQTNTFSIINTGNANLLLGNVTISGTNAADFTVITQPASTLAGGTSTTFRVRFDPSAVGLRSAVLSFTNNNVVRNPFTFSIQGSGLNTPPAISDTTNRVTAEDTPVGPIAFTIGDAETAASALTLTGISTNQTLVPNNNIVFGGSGSNRTVTITPAANVSGTTLVTLIVNDGSLTNADSFLLTVYAVNDAPTLAAISNPPAINEDAGLQTVNLTGSSAGGGETQTLTIIATSGNTNVIPNPTVTYTSPNTNGSLSYTPVPNASGSVVITVTVNDGGTSNNITTRTFTVAVNPVNDRPTVANAIPDRGATQGVPFSYTFPANTFADVDAGTTFAYSASGVPAWLTFTPATRTFSGTPADANVGFVDITVTAIDNGTPPLTTNDTFRLTVTNVNDMPVFTKGPDRSHSSGTTNAQSFAGWAIGISDGDATVTQALAFNITNSNPGLFATLPTVAANGTLTYRPNGSSGTATMGVSLTDDATAGGPALTTAVQTFTITLSNSPAPPLIDPQSLTRLGDGSFQFSFANTNNTTFSVLAATNVSLPSSNWTVLGVGTNIGGGRHGFRDSQATNSPMRFYRLRFP